MVRLALGLMLLLAVAWVGYVAVQVRAAGNRDDRVRADAIVVLGAAQYNGTPSPVFRARLDHAAQLYRGNRAPLVIVAGGKPRGDAYSEAAAGVRYLRDRGVPVRVLLAVEAGRSTITSLRAVSRVAERRGVETVLLVSDRFHLFRSLQMASDLGLEAHGSPTQTSPIADEPASELWYTLREVGAYTAYVVFGS